MSAGAPRRVAGFANLRFCGGFKKRFCCGVSAGREARIASTRRRLQLEVLLGHLLGDRYDANLGTHGGTKGRWV